jgi:hypothetical protein
VPFTMAGRACIFSAEQFWGRATQLTSHDSKPSPGTFCFAPIPTASFQSGFPAPARDLMEDYLEWK